MIAIKGSLIVVEGVEKAEKRSAKLFGESAGGSAAGVGVGEGSGAAGVDGVFPKRPSKRELVEGVGVAGFDASGVEVMPPKREAIGSTVDVSGAGAGAGSGSGMVSLTGAGFGSGSFGFGANKAAKLVAGSDFSDDLSDDGGSFLGSSGFSSSSFLGFAKMFQSIPPPEILKRINLYLLL